MVSSLPQAADPKRKLVLVGEAVRVAVDQTGNGLLSIRFHKYKYVL
jgi:hypothetical protein